MKSKNSRSCVFSAGRGQADRSEDTEKITIRRTNNKSPAYSVSMDDVSFFMNYTGYRYTDDTHTNGTRFFAGDIAPKVLKMIEAAQDRIILSVFLFDSLYSDAPPSRGLVTLLTNALVNKKRTNPAIQIAVILDPSHKGYGQRESKSEKRFRDHGIDVFYSDLICGLKRASFLGVRQGLGYASRLLDTVTFNGWGALTSGIFSKIKLPIVVDGDPLTIESAYNAALMKANHRKLLVTDDGHGGHEVMISTANPHNASAAHVNSAITVKGGLAAYTYNVLREDLKQCARLGRRHAHWNHNADKAYRKNYFTRSCQALPMPEEDRPIDSERGATVQLVTESEIERAVMGLLAGVDAGDEIRIQMFYLSRKPVIHALIDAACITKKPIRLLLDSNKEAFNREGDGTPNLQAARYTLREAKKRGGRVEIRWYATHGEQNHTKTMSITNHRTDRSILTTGSCNWTGRNLTGVNMESNVVVSGLPKITQAFNDYFDMFWTNQDGIEYSLDYKELSDMTPGDWKWTIGEKPFYSNIF